MRFTIRDVLWLTVVIAVCLAWYSQYRVYDANYRDLRMGSAIWGQVTHETVTDSQWNEFKVGFMKHIETLKRRAIKGRYSQTNGPTGDWDIGEELRLGLYEDRDQWSRL